MGSVDYCGTGEWQRFDMQEDVCGDIVSVYTGILNFGSIRGASFTNVFAEAPEWLASPLL